MIETTTADQPTADAPQVPEAPVPAFVNRGERYRVVPLEWPIEYDGKVYDEITVRRMNAREVQAFMEEVRVSGSKAHLPMTDVPIAVLDALDADDSAALNEAILDFLPRALRATDEPDPSA